MNLEDEIESGKQQVGDELKICDGWHEQVVIDGKHQVYKVSLLMSLASVSYREVEAIVQTWTKKYQYHISLLESKTNEVKFMVEFSLPQAQKPVPVANIRVYFTCRNHEQLNITFRFEKDSLIHSPNKTIRKQEIEKWIDDSLSKKLLVRETVFYLGTAYESTRVKDQRQDNILREEIKPQLLEEVWIHPDLLADQRRLIDIMEKLSPNPKAVEAELKKRFKEVDPENIGVITYAEYLTLIKNVGIKLTAQEEKDLLKRMDPQETGTVEYDNYKAVSGEFFEGLEAKRGAEAKLQANYEEEIFSSILMLINDEAQDVGDFLLQKFRSKDEDQTGLTNISDVKTILDELNKKYKEQGKAEPLSVVELADVTKAITDAHGYKEIPFKEVHRFIIQSKVKQLSTGRINSRVNNLEAHLQQIFAKHDEKKNGRIRLESMEEALKRSQKIKLSRSQIYLLKSLLATDGKGEVSYADQAKFLAELIKRLYLCSSKKKQ